MRNAAGLRQLRPFVRVVGGVLQDKPTNRTNYGVWGQNRPNNLQIMGGGTDAGFLDSQSGEYAGLADQEDQIAENIFDWWISGKSYEKWYADKFLQQKLF